jgi:hypothetical protein
VRPSDMFFALGIFTTLRTSEHCYYVYDWYDFDVIDLPFWLQPTRPASAAAAASPTA